MIEIRLYVYLQDDAKVQMIHSKKITRIKISTKVSREKKKPFAKDLLKDRNTANMIGLLTGPCRLPKHRYDAGLAEDTTCRF